MNPRLFQNVLCISILIWSLQGHAQRYFNLKTSWKEQPYADSLYQTNKVIGLRIENFGVKGDSIFPFELVQEQVFAANGAILKDSVNTRMGYTIAYTYNERGQLLEEAHQRRGRAWKVYYKYVNNVQIGQEVEEDQQGQVKASYFHTYNDLGEIVSMHKSKQLIGMDTVAFSVCEYNDASALTSKIDVDFSNGYEIRIERMYTYDKAGRLVSESKSMLGAENLQREYFYEDLSDNVVLVDHVRKRKLLYEYNPQGLLIKKTYYDGAGNETGQSHYRYTFADE